MIPSERSKLSISSRFLTRLSKEVSHAHSYSSPPGYFFIFFPKKKHTYSAFWLSPAEGKGRYKTRWIHYRIALFVMPEMENERWHRFGPLSLSRHNYEALKWQESLSTIEIHYRVEVPKPYYSYFGLNFPPIGYQVLFESSEIVGNNVHHHSLHYEYCIQCTIESNEGWKILNCKVLKLASLSNVVKLGFHIPVIETMQLVNNSNSELLPRTDSGYASILLRGHEHSPPRSTREKEQEIIHRIAVSVSIEHLHCLHF